MKELQQHPSPLIIAAFALFLLLSATLTAQEPTVRVNANGRDYFGQALAFDGTSVVLKRRDGRISILKVAGANSIHHDSRSFKPYKAREIRERLQKEFGSKYQVSATGNFVVVHPPGDFQKWATPFESLYQRFGHYFTSRGFSLQQPEFPMVAVVLRSRREFDKFLTTYHEYDSQTLGYYSQKSNRIITFDPTGGRGAKKDWAFNSTLIHEAVHQTAFNVGMHRRFGFTPKWLLEGLACMFEAKGVHNSMYFSDLRDRINSNRLAMLLHYYRQNRVQGKLTTFIANDQIFETDPGVAYAYSWGLTFFLAEKYPVKLFQFLRADAAREEFQEFGSRERLQAFEAAFGDDLPGMEKRLERFVEELGQRIR